MVEMIQIDSGDGDDVNYGDNLGQLGGSAADDGGDDTNR